MVEYPIYIGGKQAGRLCVQRQGLYTLFTARAKGMEPLGLWLYGQDGRVCLGRMLPRGGGLFLSRKMTRNDMRDFPPVIEYAGDAQPDKSPVSRPGTQRSGSGPERKKEGADMEFSPSGENEMARASSDAVWYEIGGGALFCREEGLVAFPARLRDKSLVKARIRLINGAEYLVFRR